MEFRIADTFTASLGRLGRDEQKSVKTTVFDLQVDPSSPAHSFHRIDKSRDKHFWSVRASRDLRLIVHKTEASLLLCYVGHHDAAYAWAEARKIETHPATGAAQLVEVRERTEETASSTAPAGPKPASGPRLFSRQSREELLSYGVPEEWLDDVLAATEDTLLDLAGRLPAEAAEALLALATGAKPEPPRAAEQADPFAHPDAQRRFRTMHNVEELEQALDYPWDRWMIFLHPAQRELVERDCSGPARVSGSAGTGKTIVALHRAVFLARAHPEARVLLTTFSETLAKALRARLVRLIGNAPQLGERVDVRTLDNLGRSLYQAHFQPRTLASRDDLRALLAAASSDAPPHRFTLSFLLAEWEHVVDPWQVTTWDAYRAVPRLGRKTRLPEAQRAQLWAIFERVLGALAERRAITRAGMFTRLADRVRERGLRPYEFIVVDEAQDVSVSQLRFLAALGGDRPNGLFFAGDLGQRIFQQPFSWKSLGVDIRGRARTLRVNYRTSHQIRTHADRLLGPTVSDIDENVEDRRGTVSAFNGPEPEINVLPDQAAETAAVGAWLRARVAEGFSPAEIGIFYRSEAELPRGQAAANAAGLPYRILDDNVDLGSGEATLSTMHLAKGLEFRAVAVIACDDGILPLEERISQIVDDSDLEEVYETERHLLYVACTRARDRLLVTAAGRHSEFLEDLVV